MASTSKLSMGVNFFLETVLYRHFVQMRYSIEENRCSHIFKKGWDFSGGKEAKENKEKKAGGDVYKNTHVTHLHIV